MLIQTLLHRTAVFSGCLEEPFTHIFSNSLASSRGGLGELNYGVQPTGALVSPFGFILLHSIGIIGQINI